MDFLHQSADFRIVENTFHWLPSFSKTYGTLTHVVKQFIQLLINSPDFET